ncbi:MAG: polysulfide reductase NrfD, partial [Pirellulales bacterium]|nr:polysulfide reductase NrfD [Pirellulales bacterium]
AGGFVVAGTVYIFGREKYRSFARPAILTACLGYISFVVALLYDLGLPWHIWYPIIYPQIHSVLFEVALCVMLYLTVLLLEFAPVVLESPWFDRPLFRRIHKLLHHAVIPLVIAGIVLSTLHQSSLGSLFLITPYRLNPLWYSPMIWILFLISAVGLGLMVVVVESFFSAWLFGRELRKDRLSVLGSAACVVMFLYAGLRLGDLLVRGDLGMALDGSRLAFVFLLEIALSALIPATLLLFRRVRASMVGLGICAVMVIFGVAGYRFNVAVVAFERRMPYFPTWIELAVSVGIVACALLAYIFFVEKLRVYPKEQKSESNASSPSRKKIDYWPTGTHAFLPESLGAPRRYSLAAVIAAALAVAFLPQAVLSGRQPERTPVSAARTLNAWVNKQDGDAGRKLVVATPETPVPDGAKRLRLMLIDGNRDGRAVLFAHHKHVEMLGGDDSCRSCHHQNMPLDTNTSCGQCHRDMYVPTDIFDHDFHISKLGGNEGCADCHRDPAQIKNRETAAACADCHADMLVEGSLVTPPKDRIEGIAVGYMGAMHGLCIKCHARAAQHSPRENASRLAECAACHRDVEGTQFKDTKPHVVRRAEKP